MEEVEEEVGPKDLFIDTLDEDVGEEVEEEEVEEEDNFFVDAGIGCSSEVGGHAAVFLNMERELFRLVGRGLEGFSDFPFVVFWSLWVVDTFIDVDISVVR